MRAQVVCTNCGTSGPVASTGVGGPYGQDLLRGAYEDAVKGWQAMWERTAMLAVPGPKR